MNQKTSRRKKSQSLASSFMDWLTKTIRYASVASIVCVPVLFVYLNKIQPHYYIDEKFHIPQTQEYCKGNLTHWDQKITTLPGLYLFSALILGPLELCTIGHLRFNNTILIFVNLLILLKLLKIYNQKKNNASSKSSNLYLSSWNITFFPPLFFWFFLYYTDILSVTTVLLMLLFHAHNWHKLAALTGILSVLVRQTNVIWVGLLCIENGLTVLEKYTKKPELVDSFNVLPLLKTLWSITQMKAKRGMAAFSDIIDLLCELVLPYFLVLLAFLVFLIVNGGIVVGDKSAHVPTIHVTQLFYFSSFVFVFSWPYLLPYVEDYLNFTHKFVLKSSIYMCSIALVVHYNTIVHPYILADNRHYSFYIWNKYMNRYFIFKYLCVPFYALSIFTIIRSLRNVKVWSTIAYILCVTMVLVPQFLLEPRYFIIPYILFRLKQNPENWQVIFETLTTLFVNMFQFALFANKSFSWEDEEYPQRIAW